MENTNTIRGYLLNPYTGTAEETEIPNTLDSLSKTLNVQWIDIIHRRIGGKVFCIVCDDEGLLRDDPKPSAVDSSGAPILAGPLFITNEGYEDLADLTDLDVKLLDSFVVKAVSINFPSPFPVMFGVDF